MSEIRVDTISEKTSANGVAIDGLTIKDGGITATTGAIVFNEASADLDFRVESNGNSHMIFVDGGNNRVHMGAATTGNGTLNIENASNDDTLVLVSTDDDENIGPVLRAKRVSSSAADNDELFNLILTASNDAQEDTDFAKIKYLIKDASNGTEDAQIDIQVMQAGSLRSRMKSDNAETVFNEDSVDLDFRVESDQSTKAFFVNGQYGHCHITGTGSTTKVSYYSSHLGALQLGIGGGIFSYDYNVIDGPYMHNNLYFPAATAKYVGTGPTARMGMYNGQVLFHTGGSGSADGTVSETNRFKMANDGTLTATDTSIGSISDQRLKENIADHTYDIAKFKSFKPRTFDWKHPEAHTSEATTGFVAQELESVDSDWVYTTEWAGNPLNKNPKEDEEKALCNNENKKAAKLGKKDAMYISVIQQLITRIEALEG